MFGRVLLSLISISLSATAIAADVPLVDLFPNLVHSQGILWPSLILGSEGVTITGQVARARAGSNQLKLEGAFPLERSDNPRLSGWSWGFSLASTLSGVEMQDDKVAVLSPGTYAWELALGRGTTDLESGGQAGIRGYFEVAFRDQRLSGTEDLSSTVRTFQNSLGLRDHNRFVSVRIGAGVDAAGTGLVEQKPPSWTWMFTSAMHFGVGQPIDRVYFSAAAAIQKSLLRPWLQLGSQLGYFQSSNAVVTVDHSEIRHKMTAGLTAEATWAEKRSVRVSALWTWARAIQIESVGTDSINVTTSTTNLVSGVPALNVGCMVAF